MTVAETYQLVPLLNCFFPFVKDGNRTSAQNIPALLWILNHLSASITSPGKRMIENSTIFCYVYVCYSSAPTFGDDCDNTLWGNSNRKVSSIMVFLVSPGFNTWFNISRPLHEHLKAVNDCYTLSEILPEVHGHSLQNFISIRPLDRRFHSYVHHIDPLTKTSRDSWLI